MTRGAHRARPAAPLRRAALAVLGAAILVGAPACAPAGHPAPAGAGAPPRAGASADQPPSASSAAPSGGAAASTLTVAVSSDFPTLDPARAQDTESISAIQLMYETLFTYDANGDIVGRLAQSWRWSPDERTLTVSLDPAASFADGAPVTADDVVFSLQRMLSKAINAPHALAFSDLVGFDALRSAAGTSAAPPASGAGAQAQAAAVGIRAQDSETVVFQLQSPLPYLPELLAMPCSSIVERHLVEQPAAASPQWWFQHSAGSGPYVLGTSTPGVSLDLQPNAHYWRQGATDGTSPEGPFQSVEFRIVSSPTQQLRLFDAGRLDMLDPAPQPLDAAGALPAGSRLVQGGNLGLVYLGLNTKKPPFDNLKLRQAVAYALNKQALLTAAGVSGGAAAGLLPPGIGGYDPSLQPYPYDPDKARALFSAAGGKPGLAVTLLTIAANGTVQQGLTDGTAESIQRDLDAIGFAVSIQRDSWQDYYRDLAAGRANLFQGDWLADYPDAQDFLFELLDSASIGAGNASFYQNPAFDAALAAAAADPTAAARVQRYRQLDDLVYDDLPLLPEFYTMSSVLIQPWVRPDPNAALDVYLRPPLLPQLDRVWLLPSGDTGG